MNTKYKTILIPIGVIALVLILAVGIAIAGGTIGGFEIDADDTAPEEAMYSGDYSGDDWAQGSSELGLFELDDDATYTAVEDCYFSDVDKTGIPGASAFVCDGHDDPKLSGGSGAVANEVEQNIVSPSGKQPEDTWSIRDPSGSGGVGDAKSDFTHAYAYFVLADSCADDDGIADDPFIFMAGHRADNEGDAHWGFEFDQTAPDNFDSLVNPPGIDGTFILDFNRADGDLLASASVQKIKGNHEVIFELFTWDTSDTSQTPEGSFVPAPPGTNHTQAFSLPGQVPRQWVPSCGKLQTLRFTNRL